MAEQTDDFGTIKFHLYEVQEGRGRKISKLLDAVSTAERFPRYSFSSDTSLLTLETLDRRAWICSTMWGKDPPRKLGGIPVDLEMSNVGSCAMWIPGSPTLGEVSTELERVCLLAASCCLNAGCSVIAYHRLDLFRSEDGKVVDRKTLMLPGEL